MSVGPRARSRRAVRVNGRAADAIASARAVPARRPTLLDCLRGQRRLTTPRTTAPYRTHTVSNQVPPLQDVDVFASNLPLVEAVQREGAGWVSERASELGRLVGGEPQQLWGRLANENEPVLRTHDRYGNRIDEVEFHPAWHQLMKLGVEHELHSLPWTSEQPLRAHRARRAVHDRDAGRGGLCVSDHDDLRGRPGAARRSRELAAEWEPLVTATTL